MKKMLIGLAVVFLVLIVGITVYSIKIIYYVNNDNEIEVKDANETIVEETSYYDEEGVLHEFWNSGEVLSFPDDVSTWDMNNKYIREEVIHDAMQGREWGLREYPITDNFFNEWHKNGWDDIEKLFPGYERTKKYNIGEQYGLVVDDFEKGAREGIAHAVIRSKYYSTQYNFKYYLDKDYKLDKIEYISQEVVKDHTKEVARDERIYLMVKDGDEIHEDNEYLKVLKNFSDSIKMVDYTLDDMGITDELKEKKYKENCLPIPNDVGYQSFLKQEYADYEKKIANIVLFYWDEDKFEKYLISFDYDENYYLNEYVVLNREEITEEEFEKFSGIS